MSDLQNQTPADTYKGLLQVGDYTDGITNNTGATALQVTDGAGVNTALALSTNRVGVGNISPQAELDVSGGIEATTLTTSGAVTAGSVSTSGNVGIGITSPDEMLHISGTSPIIKLTDTNTNADNSISADSGVGSLFINADINNEATNSAIVLNVDGDEKMRINSAGNVGIGTAVFGTNASGGVIGIASATAPTSSPVDMVQLYAKDDAGSSRLYVRNEAGTETVLSPHAADAPSSLYDRPPGVEEMHRSANYYLGTIIFTNVDRRNALMQKQLNGEELPEDRTFTVTETFAEYNARTGADLQVEDWDANQQAMFDAQEEKVVARQAEIDAWDNEEEPPEPLESYVKKPKPDWLP